MTELQAALNARILALVGFGAKTVSCDARLAFEARGETLPQVGRTDIACDWNWHPSCAVRTVEVLFMPFDKMTSELIVQQGEFADLEDWRRGYHAYLDRSVGFRPDIEMLVERFELIEAWA